MKKILSITSPTGRGNVELLFQRNSVDELWTCNSTNECLEDMIILFSQDNKMNNKLIKKEINEVLYNCLFELADETLVNEVCNKCVDILYNNGFNDKYGTDKFNPVIPNVNLKVELVKKKFSLSEKYDIEVTYYPDINTRITLSTAQWY